MRILPRFLLATLCLVGAAHAQKPPAKADKGGDPTAEQAPDKKAEAAGDAEAAEATATPAEESDVPEPTAEEIERASKHFNRGLELYEEGEYALALIEFERAHTLVPDYRVQYNIGQVSIQVGRYARALKALRHYLDDGAGLIPEERRTEVERDVEMLKGRTATIAITSNVEGAEIVVDDLVIGTTPMAEPALMDAGEHRIEVRHKDYQPKRDQITLAGGDAVELSFELSPKEKDVVIIPPQQQPGPVTPQEQQDFTVPTIAWMTTGALAIGAGVSGALGLAAKGELDQLKRSDSEATEREVAKERAENRFLAADILTAAAVVSGGIALYLTLSSDSESDESSDEGDDEARTGREVRAVLGPSQVGVWGTF